MMAACERWLEERDIPKINLMVRTDSQVAQGFYAAIGYGHDVVVVSLAGSGPPTARLCRNDRLSSSTSQFIQDRRLHTTAAIDRPTGAAPEESSQTCEIWSDAGHHECMLELLMVIGVIVLLAVGFTSRAAPADGST